MSNSIRAILDVAMTFYPPCLVNSNSEPSVALQRAIEQFLQRKLSYDQMCGISQKIAGTSQPIERLNKILEISPDPIPVPDDLRNRLNKGNRRKTRPWTPYEDQRLLAGIYKNGIENWTSISKFVGNARTRSQCSQRWYRGLDPAICKDQWTKEEEQKLIDTISAHGDKSWTKIASKMGNRSDVQCRYKYRQLQKEKTKEGKIISSDVNQIIQPENQVNYKKPASRRINKSCMNGFDPKKQNNFLVNQNPSSELITQNAPISAQASQQLPIHVTPCNFYTQQGIQQRAFISPSGSYVPQSGPLIQTTYQARSPPVIIQASHSQQSLQQHIPFQKIQPINLSNLRNQPIQIIQQPQFVQCAQPIQSIQPIHPPPMQPVHLQITQHVQQIQPQFSQPIRRIPPQFHQQILPQSLNTQPYQAQKQ